MVEIRIWLSCRTVQRGFAAKLGANGDRGFHFDSSPSLATYAGGLRHVHRELFLVSVAELFQFEIV